MDRDNNEPSKSKGSKETFIFGSWKCRNSRKTRVASKDVTSKLSDSEKSPLAKRISGVQSSVQNSLASSSSSGRNSHGGDEQQQQQQQQQQFGCSYLAGRRAVSAYEQLHEQDFWCPRCSGKMEEPRLLACLHSVCSGCVDEFMSENYRGPCRVIRDETIDSSSIHRQQIEGCPICDFPLPRHGASVPPPHYSLQHRLVIYAVRRRLSQRAICCDTCTDEVQATQHCPACLCNFCEDCGSEHEAQQQLQHRPYGDGPSSKLHLVRPLWEAKRIRRVAVCLAHPAHPLRFHCLACQQVACKECMWRGAHRGHASEEAASAGARARPQLSAALRRARRLLNSLLAEYSERNFEALAREDGEAVVRSHTAFDMASDSVPQPCHFRSRSTISSHSKEARERIQEFSRLRRARYLIDAIFIGEDLLANGSDVEILSLKRTILKRLKFLGVPIDTQTRTVQYNSLSKNMHSGIYHCCTFCSSGGKKEATCACSGTMPGGYKGCGHGHPGHPGVHHWSCCGSIYHDGICLLPQKRTFKITL